MLFLIPRRISALATPVYTYMHIFICKHLYVYVYMFVYIYIYIYKHIYISKRGNTQPFHVCDMTHEYCSCGDIVIPRGERRMGGSTTLQHTATRAATHCNILQDTATQYRSCESTATRRGVHPMGGSICGEFEAQRTTMFRICKSW